MGSERASQALGEVSEGRAVFGAVIGVQLSNRERSDRLVREEDGERVESGVEGQATVAAVFSERGASVKSTVSRELVHLTGMLLPD